MLKLLPYSLKNTQSNLFHEKLRDMLDSNDSLIHILTQIKKDQRGKYAELYLIFRLCQYWK